MTENLQQSSAPSGKPPCTRADALAVLNRLHGAGHVAYFAGGCVRDMLLGRDPKDWDVATDAPPNRVRALFPNTQAVGAAFGVILVHYHRSVVEVATFRADGDYIDGRHPTGVRFTTAEEDARRRDFTINGLFLDPQKPGSPPEQVIDYVGGRADLAAGLIRAIGDPEARFREDHLRMLRAVRFAARFGFTIESDTEAAIQRHANHLIRISPERIADELRIMLTPISRASAYLALGHLGLRKQIFRFVELPGGTGRLGTDASIFSSLTPSQAIPISLGLAGASMDHYLWHGPASADVRRLFEKPVAHQFVRALRQSLKISNDESAELQGTLERLSPLLGDAEPTVAKLKRFLARPTSGLSRILLATLHSMKLVDDARASWLLEKLAELEKTPFAPMPLITGDDLQIAGVPPGPIYKRLLDTAYDEQLEGRIKTRDEAIALAMKLAK